MRRPPTKAATWRSSTQTTACACKSWRHRLRGQLPRAHKSPSRQWRTSHPRPRLGAPPSPSAAASPRRQRRRQWHAWQQWGSLVELPPPGPTRLQHLWRCSAATRQGSGLPPWPLAAAAPALTGALPPPPPPQCALACITASHTTGSTSSAGDGGGGLLPSNLAVSMFFNEYKWLVIRYKPTPVRGPNCTIPALARTADWLPTAKLDNYTMHSADGGAAQQAGIGEARRWGIRRFNSRLCNTCAERET